MASSPASRATAGSPKPLRILVVDDHPIVRRALTSLIEEADDLSVCGEAESIGVALDLAARAHPDLAIVDISLGRQDGLDLVAMLHGRYPAIRILVLSVHDEHTYADRSLKAGALGYIVKDRPAQELLSAIRRVGAGRSYLSPEATEFVLATIATRRPPEGAPQLAALSDRERHVLRLVGQGLSTREIATELELSVKTVEAHYAHIKQKLGLRNSRELTRAGTTLTERQDL